MKARIPNNNSEKQEGLYAKRVPRDSKECSNKGFKKEPDFATMMRVAKDTIEKSLEEAVLNNETKIEALKQMYTEEYIGSFNPNTRNVRNAVIKGVESLLKEELKNVLDETIRVGLENGLSEEEMLADMKEKDYVKQSFGSDCSDLAVASMHRIILYYVQGRKKDNWKAKQEEKRLETEENEAKDLNEIDEYYEAVREYTDGFRFLVIDIMQYKAENGNKVLSKFNKLEDYERYERLVEDIKTMMVINRFSEESAVRIMLQREENSSNIKILKARLAVIEQVKNRGVVRQDITSEGR